MTVALKLKKRHRDDLSVSIPIDVLKNVYSLPPEKGKEQLYTQLKQITEAAPEISDIDHLKTIINWTPPNAGLPLTEVAKWFKLADQVNGLGENAKTLNISNRSAKLIWERVNNPEFKFIGIGPFVEFIREFAKAGNFSFPEDEEEDEE